MREDPPGKRIVPLALGLGMIAVVVAAGLSPNAVATTAPAGCAYNQCPAGTSIPWWAIGAIVVLVLVGLIAAVLLFRRRRPPAAAAPVQPWQEPTEGPPSGATGGPPSGATGVPPPYLETPEDVSQGPPPVPIQKTAVPPPPPAGEEPEPDIDSLMAELDKISGEILKRAPKQPPGEKTETGSDEESST
ncbi:MAG TPA: hypothetical protein VEH57_08970 [Thermoplasmata archaeon]|nr:hypothetical protein [Thermoplasmata archaeon]